MELIDSGVRETDALLEGLEKKISQEYQTAEREMQKKLDRYLQRYEAMNAKKLAQVESGTLSVADYEKWKQNRAYDRQWYESMVDTLSRDAVYTDRKVMSIVNGYLPEAYAINHNFSAFQLEQGAQMDMGFTLYSRQTVERMMRDDPALVRAFLPDEQADLRWHKQKFNSAITQGILQGESIPKISSRLKQVTGMDDRAAVRNARTAMTSAQNAGRIDAYKEAEDLGIEVMKEWMATLDGRTRHSHRQLDGERKKTEEAFSNHCMYPADPRGDGSEIYNCRCTLVPYLPKYPPAKIEYQGTRMNGMTYEEWKQAKAPKRTVPPVAAESVKTDATFKNAKGLTDEFKEGMALALSKSKNDLAKRLYARYEDELVCTTPDLRSGAYFSSIKGGVSMNLVDAAKGSDYERPYEVAFHEFGHMVDWLSNGKDGWTYLSNTELDGKRLLAVITSDYKAFKKTIGAKKNAEVIEYLAMEEMSLKERGNISDILEKCTNTSYPLGLGHGKAYHKREGATEKEFFAEVLDSAVTNEAAYNQMVRLFPNAVDMVWKLIGGVLG